LTYSDDEDDDKEYTIIIIIMTSSSKKFSHLISIVSSVILQSVILLSVLQSTKITATAEPIQLYGLNYNTRQGPDWDSDKCKPYETIYRDLTMIARVTNRIRILSLTDCGQGELVMTVANALGLQLWLGLWIGPDHETKFQEELDALETLLNKFSDTISTTVLGVTVGSEAIYREDITWTENVAYLNEVRSILETVPGAANLLVSIVDVLPFYQATQGLRDAVDVIYTNNFPFWESISVDNAIADFDRDIKSLFSVTNKQLIIGETGWPGGGFNAGVGAGDPDDQAQHFAEAYCYLTVDNPLPFYWFTAIEDAWRQEQDPNNSK
jgi:exo-beta-1,3-glucanase (GH17 family)